MYGAQVLSHPLIVDGIENAFIPVCIHNNTEGDDDARIREAFEEPSWNNPVVRILDSEKKDIIERIHDDWSRHALVRGMKDALVKRKKPVPAYLDLWLQETDSRKRGVETAIFGMF